MAYIEGPESVKLVLTFEEARAVCAVLGNATGEVYEAYVILSNFLDKYEEE